MAIVAEVFEERPNMLLEVGRILREYKRQMNHEGTQGTKEKWDGTYDSPPRPSWTNRHKNSTGSEAHLTSKAISTHIRSIQ
jgi:hypothetical protein